MTRFGADKLTDHARAVTAAYIGATLVEVLASEDSSWPEDFSHPSVFVMGLDQAAKHEKAFKDLRVYG
jgi:hypothetical protein